MSDPKAEVKLSAAIEKAVEEMASLIALGKRRTPYREVRVHLRDLARKVAEEERERCARVARSFIILRSRADEAAEEIAEEILARK